MSDWKLNTLQPCTQHLLSGIYCRVCVRPTAGLTMCLEGLIPLRHGETRGNQRSKFLTGVAGQPPSEATSSGWLGMSFRYSGVRFFTKGRVRPTLNSGTDALGHRSCAKVPPSLGKDFSRKTGCAQQLPSQVSSYTSGMAQKGEKSKQAGIKSGIPLQRGSLWKM